MAAVAEVGRSWPKPPCFRSAWIFAKHCPARARPSTSPLPLVPTSPSPWTPGVRQQAQGSRRRQAPPPWGGMLGGERNTSRGSKTLQQWTLLKKWKLFLMRSPVTSVTTNQPLRRGWGSTREWSTNHHSRPSLVLLALKAWEKLWATVQLSWTQALCLPFLNGKANQKPSVLFANLTSTHMKSLWITIL